MSPKVSVIMSVYNGESFLKQAIASILDQTFSDFELLLIDDASSDRSAQIISQFSSRDDRLRIITNEANIGLTASLNKGIKLARSEFIARMDADDIALPGRLEKQIEFLDSHLEIGLVGTACVLIGEQGQQIGLLQQPVTDLQIRWFGLLSNPFTHPTVMFRRGLLIENDLNYDEKFYSAQDYDLWMRLLRCTQAANLAEPLLKYRVASSSITNNRRAEQLRNNDIIAYRTIQESLPGLAITQRQVSRLRALYMGGEGPGAGECCVDQINLYLTMFNAFARLRPESEDMSSLMKDIMYTNLTIVSESPYDWRWGAIVCKLISLDPVVFCRYAARFFSKAVRRLV